jgi:hypothetical protein
MPSHALESIANCVTSGASTLLLALGSAKAARLEESQAASHEELHSVVSFEPAMRSRHCSQEIPTCEIYS